MVRLLHKPDFPTWKLVEWQKAFDHREYHVAPYHVGRVGKVHTRLEGTRSTIGLEHSRKICVLRFPLKMRVPTRVDVMRWFQILKLQTAR